MLSINPFMNPIFLIKLLKSHLSDVNRIWISTDKQLKAYQDKALRKIIRYAYNVPLYHDKFKSHGIKPSDIKGINDIDKLPFITKNDLRSYYPDGIIPTGFDKKYAFTPITERVCVAPLVTASLPKTNHRIWDVDLRHWTVEVDPGGYPPECSTDPELRIC